MPAWGAEVGGPLNEQQIDNLIDYLASIQLSPDEAHEEIGTELAVELGLLGEQDKGDPDAVDAAIEQIDYADPQGGELLFNLGHDDELRRRRLLLRPLPHPGLVVPDPETRSSRPTPT